MTVKLCERLLHDIHYFHGKKIIIKALLYYEVQRPKTTDSKSLFQKMQLSLEREAIFF